MEQNENITFIKKKPVVSHYKSGNPTKTFEWVYKLTDINIIRTKNITPEFASICVANKNKIFLHVEISGLGATVFEPNIDAVKTTFIGLRNLIDLGFPPKQILVIVTPILNNDNGLKSLQLLLRVFTEFSMLRLRNIRFELLRFKSTPINYDKGTEHIIKPTKRIDKFSIANTNISQRNSTKSIQQYLFRTEDFFKQYYQLIERYKNIIHVDTGLEPLIGIRELQEFGYSNTFIDGKGNVSKIIIYENENRYKPMVNIISYKPSIRCVNKCLLCPNRG
jgi:hypothetical protein